jgi:zinc protease
MKAQFKRIALIIFLSVIVFYAFKISTHKPVFGIEQAQLKNGMQVYVVRNGRVPAVTHMVWYKVGAAQDPMGQSGIAHYLEHLMFTGTKNIPNGAFSKIVQRWGGNDNAFTSKDYTAYFQTIPTAHLEDVMRMEADRMQNLISDPLVAQNELNVVMNERRERTDNEPQGKLQEKVQQALYGTHPYARPTIGPMEELKTLNLEKALAFYRAHYVPNNAYLVISGDVNLKTVLSLAEKYYGALTKRNDIVLPIFPVILPLAKDVVIEQRDSSVKQPVMWRSLVVDSYATNKDKALALSVLTNMLDGASGKLYQELVVKQKLVSQIDVSYDPNSKDKTTFDISWVPMAGVQPEKIETALKLVLANYAPLQTDLQRAQQSISDSAIFMRDSLAGPAMVVGMQLASGVTVQDIDQWPYLLNKVKLQSVNDALKTIQAPAVYARLLP